MFTHSRGTFSLCSTHRMLIPSLLCHLMCRLLRQGHAYSNRNVKIASCVSSLSDENQFEMDI